MGGWLLFTTKWVNIECLVLHEISQPQKIYIPVPLLWDLVKLNLQRTCGSAYSVVFFNLVFSFYSPFQAISLTLIWFSVCFCKQRNLKSVWIQLLFSYYLELQRLVCFQVFLKDMYSVLTLEVRRSYISLFFYLEC